MDKLKGILVYHFWILSGLALILPIAGWWTSTSGMMAEYEARVTTLKGQFDSVTSGGPKPNDNWTKPLVELNQQEAQLVEQTRNILWENQVRLMTWPENISGAMNKLRYKDPIGDEERTLYRSSYDVEIERTWELVRPLKEQQDGEVTGLVAFPLDGIPSDNWGSSPFLPASDRMWESQEDIWLMRTILSAIDAVNVTEGATTSFDAPIKEITKIEFRGGGPKVAAAASGTDGPGAEGGMPTAGTMGGRNNANSKGVDASFDPAEEFGPDTDNSGDAGGDAGGPAADAGPSSGDGMNGAGGGKKRKRYIEENEDFKTRGFYLEVVIDHRKVPDLLVSLANSPWPIRVVRVQQVDRDYSDIASIAGSASGPSGTMGASRPRRDPMGTLPTAGSGFGPSANAERGADPAAAMSDPYLVNLAVAGIITIYLPPPEKPEEEGAVPVEETPVTAPVPESEDVPDAAPLPDPATDSPATPETPAPSPTTEDEDNAPVPPTGATPPPPAAALEEEES